MAAAALALVSLRLARNLIDQFLRFVSCSLILMREICRLLNLKRTPADPSELDPQPSKPSQSRAKQSKETSVCGGGNGGGGAKRSDDREREIFGMPAVGCWLVFVFQSPTVWRHRDSNISMTKYLLTVVVVVLTMLSAPFLLVRAPLVVILLLLIDGRPAYFIPTKRISYRLDALLTHAERSSRRRRRRTMTR